MAIKNPNTKETTFVGLVLAAEVFHPQCCSTDYETVYATVWNAEKGEPEDVPAGVAAYGLQERWATEDATPEIREAFRSWRTAKEDREREYRYQADLWRVLAFAKSGDRAVVVGGRKAKAGTEVAFEWAGTTRDGRMCGRTPEGVWINRERFAVVRPGREVSERVTAALNAGLDIREETVAGRTVFCHRFFSFGPRPVDQWVTAE
jgi:hypothetical protein